MGGSTTKGANRAPAGMAGRARGKRRYPLGARRLSARTPPAGCAGGTAAVPDIGGPASPVVPAPSAPAASEAGNGGARPSKIDHIDLLQRVLHDNRSFNSGAVGARGAKSIPDRRCRTAGLTVSRQPSMPMRLKMLHQSPVTSTSSMAAALTAMASLANRRLEDDATIRRKRPFRMERLSCANTWVSSGCKSHVIFAGMKTTSNPKRLE